MSMTPEQQAARMERMTAAIMVAIDQNGGAEDVHVIMGSLGAAIGSIALATGRPEECLDLTISVARGVIHGSLLD
jgi:hypothetical protein